jgi:ribosomal protein S18 acetylase RimI-like enzyme
LDTKIAAVRRPEIRVEQVNDPQEVNRFLARDRIYAAYALGSLETEPWDCCRALLARTDDEDLALYLLLQPSETVTTLLLMGEPEALEETFHHPAARTPLAWITAKDEHLKCLKRHWQTEKPEAMLRMVVSRETFVAPSIGRDIELRELARSDKPDLEEAYDAAFGTPGAARLLHRGPYYGVWRGGRLASVAGTHIVAQRIGLAAVGNVWTRPGFRGQGLATLTAGAVTQKLLEGQKEVVLNVREDNQTAKLVYERLGYRTYCSFWQVRGRWRKLR